MLKTRKEVAEIFRVTTLTVDRWRKDGTLPAIKVGKSVRFQLADIKAILNAREKQR